MKKIKRVTIENFQSHKKSEISFDNFSVIIGHTDSGKSAIIRAIKWCLYNTPDGSDFIRFGEQTTKVTIYFDDETYLTRSKGKENHYEVFDGTKTIHLEAFGRGPVEDIINFHGMRETNFFGDNQSLNICDQFSQPFFLAESPGSKAEMIGRIANIDVIDKAIKNVNSEIREKKATLKAQKDQLASVNLKLKQYDFLGDLEKDIESFSDIIKKTTDLNIRLNKITLLMKEYEETEAKVKIIDEICKTKDSVKNAVDNIGEAINVNSGLHNILNIIEAYKVNNEKLDKIQNFLSDKSLEQITKDIINIELSIKNLDKINKVKFYSEELRNNFDKLERLSNILERKEGVINALEEISFCQTKLLKLVKVKTFTNELSNYYANYRSNEEYLQKLNEQKEEAHNKYKEKLLENPSCPICKSSIDKKNIDKIKDFI